eukprot:455018_1
MKDAKYQRDNFLEQKGNKSRLSYIVIAALICMLIIVIGVAVVLIMVVYKTKSSNSTTPSPTPSPTPQRKHSIFGGFYSVNQYNPSSSINNPYTNELGCPSYTTGRWASYQIGVVMGHEHSYTDWIFVCLNDDYNKIDPLQFFGGVYQVADINQCEWSNIVNPMTAQLSCPDGMTAMKVGRVQTVCINGNAGANIMFCYNVTLGLNNGIFGGFYQEDQTGADRSDEIYNQYTHSLECPISFNQHAFANVYAPEDRCGSQMHVCLSNI